MNLGPIVFYEHLYYFKEVMPDQPVYISVELNGLSEKGTFFSFKQNMYDATGQNVATYEMMGAWIDMNQRKLRELPQEFLQHFKAFQPTDDFKVLTKEDTRKYHKIPKHINPEVLKNTVNQ